MTDMCHRNKKKGHTGQLDQRFSRPQVGAALGFGAAGTAALSIAAAASATPLVLVGLPLVLLPGITLGGHRFLNTSAEGVPPCGGIKITVRITWSVSYYDLCICRTWGGHAVTHQSYHQVAAQSSVISVSSPGGHLTSPVWWSDTLILICRRILKVTRCLLRSMILFRLNKQF